MTIHEERAQILLHEQEKLIPPSKDDVVFEDDIRLWEIRKRELADELARETATGRAIARIELSREEGKGIHENYGRYADSKINNP